MNKKFLAALFGIAFSSFGALAQTAAPRPTPNGNAAQTAQRRTVFDFSEYGVSIQPDSRLIVMLAALEAAGFDALQGAKPGSQKLSEFRQTVRADGKMINDDLRNRLRVSLARNTKRFADMKLAAVRQSPQSKNLSETQIAALAELTPAEIAAPYISLAYALTPELASPERTDELPGDLLEILDFAPLVREFYKQSNMAQRMPEYTRRYREAADKLRLPTAQMIVALTSYLNTRPQTVFLERVTTRTTEGKKGNKVFQNVETRQRARRFVIVPELLTVPETVNFRNIGDDYFAVVSENFNPSSSELRRAFLQYLVDPLIFKNGRDIAVHREGIRQILEQQRAVNPNISPDIFLAVVRSLVAAIDAREIEFRKTEAATAEARQKIDKLPKDALDSRRAVSAELEKHRQSFSDATIAELSDAYERGAVLSFFFADKLKDLESSGFDVTSAFPDMIASFDAAKETSRMAENSAARRRGIEARRKVVVVETADPNAPRMAVLIEKLKEIEAVTNQKEFDEAEKRLQNLLSEYPNEPRIFFALGRTASLSARGVFDENLRDFRLGKAFESYSNAIKNASLENDKALISQAYVAIAQILEFQDRTQAALQAFEAAAKIGDVEKGAYKEALAGKQRLSKPQ